MMRTVQIFGKKADLTKEQLRLEIVLTVGFIGFGILAYLLGGPEVFRQALRSIGGP